MTRIEVEIYSPHPTQDIDPRRINVGQPAVTLRQGRKYWVDEEFFDDAIMRRVEDYSTPVDTPDEAEGEPKVPTDLGDEDEDEAPEADDSSPEAEEEPEPEPEARAEEEEAASEPPEDGDEETTEAPHPEGEPSMDWLKEELVAYAEEVGASTSGRKEDILTAIEEERTD